MTSPNYVAQYGFSSPQSAAPAASASSGFTGADWASIIAGLGQGAMSAMGGVSGLAGTKREAKEAKRRTLSNLLNQALKREQALTQAKSEYGREMTDFQSQALQNAARGFLTSLKGSTRM